MANLTEKLKQLEDALKSWKKVLGLSFSKINRDASILRFELSYELLWKVIKMFIYEVDRTVCYSPKTCFRKIKNILDLTEKDVELCINMADKRNFAVHIYSEDMVDDLYKELDNYCAVVEKIYKKMKEARE